MGCSQPGFASCRVIRAALLLLALPMTQQAIAAPPAVNVVPISVSIPPLGGVEVINLRQIGVLSGSAPLELKDAQVLINGQTTGLLVASIVRGNGPGSVCVLIRNADYSLRETDPPMSLRITVSKASGGSAGPTSVPLVNRPGPAVDRASCDDPNTTPVAIPGANRTVADTDGVAGELVVLNGSGSSDADAGSILTYRWASAGVALGAPSTNPTLSTRLGDGQHVVDLTVTDDSGDTATQSDSARMVITINAPQRPTVSAGTDRTVADTNGVPGETVTLTATANDPDGTIRNIEWRLGNTLLGTGATIQASLADGVNDITVSVTDNSGLVAQDNVRITVTSPVARVPPTVNAGVDRTIADTNGVPGENVSLTATASDADGTIQSYSWRLGETVIGNSATIQAALPDGVNEVSVTVTDNAGLTATATVRITVTAPQLPPTVNAGADRTIADTNGVAGESVTLTAAASDPDGTIQSYSWRVGNTVLGTTATIQATLPDGVSDVSVTVTDDSGLTASDSVRITVTAPARVPTINAGADRTVADTDNVAGESVTLTATASDPDGTVQSVVWQLGQTVLGTGTTIQAALPDGVNDIIATATDNSGLTASDSVRITVSAPLRAPSVNAGADRVVADTNGAPGESVTLTATASDPDGTIASYVWRIGDTQIGTGETIQATLPDGVSDITVTVTDNSGLTASDSVRITVGATQAPTVDAGADRTVADTNGQPGEVVTLSAVASDPDGTIQSYAWRRGDTVLGNEATIQATLPDGVSDITVTVTDNTGLTASDSVRITLTTAAAPVANAGSDQTLADTDGAAGELVSLAGSATDADGTIAAYQWLLGQTQIATGATPQVRLADGVNLVTLLVTDNTGNTGTDSVQITVNGGVRPTASAGADQTVADSDGLPGELVNLAGSGTDSDGSIARFEWLLGETSLGIGASVQARLPDGINTVTLRVTDNVGTIGTDTLLVTVGVAVLPVANAGSDRTLTDSDRQPGELVSLAGSATTRTGTIVSYRWLLGSEPLGTGNPLQVRLPDGANLVTLIVTNSASATSSDTVQITVGAPPVRTSLSALPNLDPTQKSVAQSLDRICVELDDALVSGRGLTIDQRALNRRCEALYFGNTGANQEQALGALVTDNFAVARTQTLLFANSQYASVMDRLIALRGGARGLSLAGLNIVVDGASIPLAELQEMGKQLLGGGASADSREPGGLLNDKVGVWARGNYSFGDKDAESRSPGFDAKQWTLVGGADYRVSDRAVVGGALTYGVAEVDFTNNDGGLGTRSWALSLYGSMYSGKNFYLDAIVNVADAGYDAKRNITYVDGAGLVNENAKGSTSGMTLSAGLSGGYDFLVGGLTVSPTLGVFYIDATLDSFTENGASGLNLLYDQQKFKSLTGNLGLRMTYSVNLPWAVLLPQIRVDYVREFNEDVDVFNVRFSADPDGTSAAPIRVETDNPDHSYFRLAAGVSAQLRFGLSGYVEYQRLQSFQFISFSDLAFGVRAQRGF